ncbi:MAG: hypothetical protein ACRD9R_21665, partial [Pyrinomonadaceae bacterium]
MFVGWRAPLKDAACEYVQFLAEDYCGVVSAITEATSCRAISLLPRDIGNEGNSRSSLKSFISSESPKYKTKVH